MQCITHKIRSAYLHPFESYGGVQNFKFRSRDPEQHHFRGQFAVHRLGHVMVSVNTKYEVSIFGHSKDIKGSQNFENGHVSHAHLLSNFHISTRGFMQCISPQNLECVVLSLRKSWRVPNCKFRSRDPDHAPLGDNLLCIG